MDKKKQTKEKFVQHLIDLYVKKQDKEDWNLNDSFDIACWFWSEMVARIADNHIVPHDELHKRVKRIMKDCVEDVFQQIKEKL